MQRICDVNKYTLVNKISDSVFTVLSNYDNTLGIMKIINPTSHTLTNYNINVIQHSLNMTKLFSDLKLGPKLLDSFTCGNNLYLITEMMSPLKPYNYDGVLNLSPEVIEKIKAKIKYMHNLGIIHGDLHSGNIVSKDGEYYFVDVDTAFRVCDFFTLDWPKQWIHDGFEIDDFFDFVQKETENFIW